MIQLTRAWVEKMVIGLNFCPFAEKIFNADTIRYAVSDANNTELLLKDFARELQLLLSSDRSKIETTLFIFPHVLKKFADFNDFTYKVDKLIGTSGNRGIVQIAGFHPEYQFEGTTEDSPENYTNRSPYPMLHLLREISITEVANSRKDLLEIPENNIKNLKAMGKAKILQRLEEMKRTQDDSF